MSYNPSRHPFVLLQHTCSFSYYFNAGHQPDLQTISVSSRFVMKLYLLVLNSKTNCSAYVKHCRNLSLRNHELPEDIGRRVRTQVAIFPQVLFVSLQSHITPSVPLSFLGKSKVVFFKYTVLNREKMPHSIPIKEIPQRVAQPQTTLTNHQPPKHADEA
jgi:hypothetical protein